MTHGLMQFAFAIADISIYMQMYTYRSSDISNYNKCMMTRVRPSCGGRIRSKHKGGNIILDNMTYELKEQG